jgi:hypothetical protein
MPFHASFRIGVADFRTTAADFHYKPMVATRGTNILYAHVAGIYK